MIEMARIFTLLAMPEGKKNFKALKNFDATDNSEFCIASALFEGNVCIKCKGVVAITKTYDYSCPFYCTENGRLKPLAAEDRRVSGINYSKIQDNYQSFIKGEAKATKLPEAYTFIKEEIDRASLPILNLGTELRYDYRIFPKFIKEILNNPDKYPSKIVEICKIVYGGQESPSLYGMSYSEDMVRYPRWLQPIGVIADRVGSTTWNISAEIDSQLAKLTVTYDSKGISEFGPVGLIELAGKIAEEFILGSLRDTYLHYTKDSIDYKICVITTDISRYIEYVRGEDFRKNYNSGFMKNPDDFIVDMEQLLRASRDSRMTKKEVYEVVDYFKNNPSIFRKYADASNSYMDQFYPWFEGRVSKGKNLFKNVPKD